jgi:hypothetical protein
LGHVPFKVDISLFFYIKALVVIDALVCVDDIIVASSSSHVVEALLAELKPDFALTDWGDLHFFPLVLRSRKHLKAYCSVRKICF